MTDCPPASALLRTPQQVQSRNTLSASSTTPRTSSANTSKLSFQGFMTMTGLSTWRAKFHHPQDSHPQQSSNNLDFRVSSVASGVPSNDDTNEKPFNWKLFAVATITASSGLLFGYDLGIIGTLPSITGFEYFYISRSANRAPPPSPPSPSRGSEGRGSVVSAVCPSTEGNPMASVGNYLALSLFLSGMIGGFLGSVLCPAVGRRKTLICAAGIYTTGTVLEGLAVTSPMFFIGRAVMGIGVGITNQAGASSPSPPCAPVNSRHPRTPSPGRFNPPRKDINYRFSLSSSFPSYLPNCPSPPPFLPLISPCPPSSTTTSTCCPFPSRTPWTLLGPQGCLTGAPGSITLSTWSRRSSHTPACPFQVAPIYLAEIAPARNRGAIGISFQFFITFGILLASGVGFLLTVRETGGVAQTAQITEEGKRQDGSAFEERRGKASKESLLGMEE